MTTDEATRPIATEVRPLREVSVALAVFLALVTGPNALGLLARLSTLALRRFSAWWPPQSLEPLPLGVAGLVILVTAYALATRGSRTRSPGLAKHRRFLPPLDLLLLQLGNVTFMAFALILAVVSLGLLSSALRALTGRPWLVSHGLGASLAVAAAGALVGLRRSSRGSPNAVRRRWSKRAAILGAAVGACWLIGSGAERSLLKLRLEGSPVDLPGLASLYGLLWIFLAGSVLLTRFEQPATGRSTSSPSRRPFTAPFLLVWSAYLGFFTLYLYGVLLTLRAHLTPR